MLVRPPARIAVAASAARRLIVRGEQVLAVTETCSEFNDMWVHLVLRLSHRFRRLGARRAASRATTPRTSTHLHGQLGSGPAHRSRNGRLARYEGLKSGA